MKTISLRGITESLSASEMKLVKGGNPPKSLEVNDDVPEGGSGGGNKCWHYCWKYDGVTRTASVWGTCYDAYQECNRRGETAECGCNG